jgi:hypothetical protein
VALVDSGIGSVVWPWLTAVLDVYELQSVHCGQLSKDTSHNK